MTELFRYMIEDRDGRPLIAQTAKGLGVRAGEILSDGEGYVEPGTGGMSAVLDPRYLPKYRRPPKFGGDGEHPVWEIAEDERGEALTFRLDDKPEPKHGVVEPAWRMTLDEYVEALAETRDSWRVC